MKQKQLSNSQKNLVIVSSSKEEAITSWFISRHKKEGSLLSLIHRTGQITLVLLSDLLKNAQIQDILTQEEVCIHWVLKEVTITNHTHCLLNRVTYIDHALFKNYCASDKEYAKREFEAYLGFSLNNFDKVQAVAINGLCERIYSLPQQWNLVRRKLGLSVPSYFWGLKQEKKLTVFPIESRIDSMIYDYLRWTTLPSIDIKNVSTEASEFYFQKPQGTPVFALSVGQRVLISTDLFLSQRQEEAVKNFTNQIRMIFNYFIFELLIFMENDGLVFGCVNIEIIHSRKNPAFFTFLDKYLIDEYYECLT